MSYADVCNSVASQRLATLYQNFANYGKYVKASGGFVGGTAATGGMSTVAEYADSVYSKAKEDMIRKIAADMNSILGIKGDKKLNSDGPIEALVAKMNDILPNPRKKRGIRSDKAGESKYSSVHKELCKALAESINKNYGTQIIDLSQSDNALCNSVAEVVHSLIMGMHAEFSTIAADVSQVIRNLTVMMEYLKKSHEKMKEVVDASKDENIKLQSERVDDFYKKLVAETDRQLAILNNMMGGVIGPVNNDFVQVMKESEDFKGFVDDIKSALGSEQFGNKLGYLLAGVNNLAQTAKMVDKALKEIGMSVKAYKGTSGIENLRDEIYGLLAKSDKLTADGLVKFMKAADVLYRNDLQHEQIVEYLEKGSKSGGYGCPNCGASGGDCGCGGVAGGLDGGADGKAYTDMFERKENTETDRYKSLDKARTMIFKDFEKQLLTIYQRIIASVQQIGPKIGNEIQVSDDLMKFVRAFNQIEGANRQSIASALSGYNKSGAAKDARNSFLSSLEVVDITIDPLVGKHNTFRELRNEINVLMKLVETFSSKFIEALTTPLSFKGGFDGGVIVNTDPPAGMTERYASFGRAQFQLYYFSRIASIKRSMARAATEKKEVGEDYEKLVGQAAAQLINSQASEYKKHMESLNYWDKEANTFANAKDFDSKLPLRSPGRALYFYVNTVSGYEPLAIPAPPAAVPLPDTAYLGNLTAAGSGAGAANTTDWGNAATWGNALADRFVRLWNFNNVATGGAAGNNFTPDAVQVSGGAGAGALFNPASNLLNVLGTTVPDITTTKDGAVADGTASRIPRALDKTHPGSLMDKRVKAATKLVEIIKDLEKKAFDAKKDLVEVAQNVDLYLSSFTDSMLSKPESLLSLAKILQRVAVVRKMYTDASGENLAKVFELFPVQIVNTEPITGATTGNAANGVRSHGQVLSDIMAPGNVVQYNKPEHYYEYVKDVCQNASSLGNHKIALDLANIMGDSKENNVEALIKTIEKSVLGIRALENVLLAFAQIGNEQTSKTFMSHGKVLKSLFNYTIYSSISRHYLGSYNNKNINTANNIAIPATPNTPFSAVNRLTEKIASYDLYGPLKTALSISLNQISYGANPDQISTFEDDFQQTDRILELILKAICSKVLTVLGLYQIYNRPTTDYLSFGALRMIIGGGMTARPKIIPEAIDLYVRLPLLAEWYRDVLVGKSDKTGRAIDLSTGSYMLALIPDVTNLWGGFLKTIFIKADNVEEGNYSEEDVNCLITEINKIYNAYRGKSQMDTVMAACEGLVSEVNTRYSIIKKDKVDQYWDKMRTERFTAEDFNPSADEDFVDFDLLDSKNGVKGKPAPSDRYMDVTMIAAAKSSGWSTETFNLVKQLHSRTFKMFHDGYQQAFGNFNEIEKDARAPNIFQVMRYSFDGVIRQYKDELKVAGSEDEKYKIACKAIQDVGRMADVNPDKIVMLHEFVIAPLTNLMSTYNLLRNVIESFIWMSRECLSSVLTYLHDIRGIDHQTIGVNVAGAALDGGGGVINVANFNRILENSLKFFHPAAAPLLQGLMINEEDSDEHGIAAATNVLNVGAAGADTKNPNTSLLLSTKKLFKTHMQLFAALKSSLGDKFTLNFTNKSYPIIDMSPLVSYCEEVLNNVKKALVYLRPSLPVSVLRKYEDSKNVGSIYWLEENMFSNLFYNEQRWRKFDESKYGASPAAAAAVLNWNNDCRKTDLRPSLPLLNEILKSSFDVVVKRANLNNGKSLCERSLMELCVWGLDKQPRFEVNNDTKGTFPFNVVDMVDDIDPALGKVRRLLVDKSIQAAVGEIAKKLGTMDQLPNQVGDNVYDNIFSLLRMFSIGQTAVAGIPANQIRNFDAQYNHPSPLTPANINDFLAEVVALFIDHIGGAFGAATAKIGSPAFGTYCVPFSWNGTSAAVAAVGRCAGVNVQAVGANDTTAGHAITFAAFNTTVNTAIAAGAAASVNTAIPLPFALSANTEPLRTNMGERVGNWILAQINELNNKFLPYIRVFEALTTPAVVSFLRDSLRIAPTTLNDLQTIGPALANLRFSIGFRHLLQVTIYGAVPGTQSLGLNQAVIPAAPGIDDLYVYGRIIPSFVNAFEPLLVQSFVNLFNYYDDDMDSFLKQIVTASIANFTNRTITDLRPQNIIANALKTSGNWSIAAPVNPLNDSFVVVPKLIAGQSVAQLAQLHSRAAMALNVNGNLGGAIAGFANAMALADYVVSLNIPATPAPPANFAAAFTADPGSVNAGLGGLAYLAALALTDATVNAAALGAADAAVVHSIVAGVVNRFIEVAGTAAGGVVAAFPVNAASPFDVATPATQTLANLISYIQNPVAGLAAPLQLALTTTLVFALEEAVVEMLGGTSISQGAAFATPANTISNLLVDCNFNVRYVAASALCVVVAVAGLQPGTGLAMLPAAPAAVAAALDADVIDPLVADINNRRIPIYLYAAEGFYVGRPYILGTDNIQLGPLNAAGSTNNAALTAVWNVGPTVVRLNTPQNSALNDQFMPVLADRPGTEAWLRRFLLESIKSPDFSGLRRGINVGMADMYGVDLNGAESLRARFEGLNVALILNRINLYDQHGDDGFLAAKDPNTKAGEMSIFASKGLLVQFNQLLASYIGSFVEPGTKKFYAPLIEGLVNSKLSDAITSGNAIADININDPNGIGIPEEGTILCASIARAIRTLLYKKLDNSKENQHATNSLLEIAAFMRESMKGNLPHFAKMFNQLADIASMYKKILLDNPTIHYERQALPGRAFTNAPVEQSERLFSKSQKKYINPFTAVTNENDLIRYYRVMLDAIELGCNSVVRCISQCYKELNDAPLFGETYSGSLMEIKQRTGKYPLTLPSALQALLNHQAYNRGIGLPGGKHGSDNFKILFMARRLVNETSMVSGGGSSIIDYMPGLVETINNYNAVNSDVSKLPKALIESSVKSNIVLMNLLFDLKLRASWILDINTIGASIFRREIYGSALEVDVNQSTVGAGFNNLTLAQQTEVRTNADFITFARSRGLALTNRNQSIYRLKDVDVEYTFVNSNGVSTKINRTSGVVNTFNNLTDYPAPTGALAPAGALDGAVITIGANDRRLVAYSDVLKYPTSLVSYSFTLNGNLSELITLNESTDLQYNKRHLLGLFSELGNSNINERKTARFFNILDLNIVPINVHALQQKVPLINLLNYAFTFEKFAIERLGVQPQFGNNNDQIFGPEEANVSNVKSAFARMLIHPYASVSPDHFNIWHSRIAVGATGSDIPMDRPKYFSDQIYNKVCLQSLNPGDLENPGGPGYVMENKRNEGSRATLRAFMAAHIPGVNATAVLAFAAGNAFDRIPAPFHGYGVRLAADLAGAGAAIVAANDLLNNAASIAAVGATFDTVATAMKRKLDGFAGVSQEIKRIVKTAIDGHIAFVKSQTGIAAGNLISADSRYQVAKAAIAGTPATLAEAFDATNLLRSIVIHLVDAFNSGTGNVSLPRRVDALFYLTDIDDDKVKRVDLRNNGDIVVNAQGKARYDTKLVRSLSWFSHLHRFLLWSIKQALVKSSQPVVSDQGIIDPSLVDFRGYETQSRKEYHL